MSNNTLSKKERLRSRNAIGQLFAGGESFFVYPLKVVWGMPEAAESHRLQAAFSVSKRNFKRAVDRNALKRLMREAYRLQKSTLLDELSRCELQLNVMFIYAVKELKDYETVSKGMAKALERLKIIVSDQNRKKETSNDRQDEK